MRNHYVPKHYLAGFTHQPNEQTLYVYVKGSQRIFPASINNIANEVGFYSDVTEAYLANEVENVANPILDKIRNREIITSKEKAAFAEYMIVMLKRVPQNRQWTAEWVTQKGPSVFAKTERVINELSAADPSRPEHWDEVRKDLERMRAENHIDVQDIWERVIPAERTPRASKVLQEMTWLFLTYEEEAFLTSDNPVFFFHWMGVGKQESEVTFPISRSICLWATWRADLHDDFVLTRRQTVHEINRRTISAATRYVFHPDREAWVTKLVNDTHIKLNKLI